MRIGFCTPVFSFPKTNKKEKMVDQQIELQDWLFPHLVNPSKHGPIHSRFPERLHMLTVVEGLVIEVQGWWPLWHPTLYLFDVTLQIVPEDVARFKACLPLRKQRVFQKPDLGVSVEKPRTTPFLRFFLVSCQIKVRPITPRTFTEIVTLLTQRFLRGYEKRRATGYKKGNLPRATDWGEAIRNTIKHHAWYQSHAVPVASSKKKLDTESPELRWTVFLNKEDENLREIESKRKINQDPDNEIKQSRTSLTWARACLISRDNMDYLCVAEYSELLYYFPMRKLAFLPSDLLGTLHKRIMKKGSAFFRLFYGIHYRQTLESLATPTCSFFHQRETVEEKESENTEDVLLPSRKRKRIKSQNREEDKKNSKKQKKNKTKRMEKKEEKEGNLTWKGDQEVQYHFWGKHLMHPAYQNEPNETKLVTCDCEGFTPRQQVHPSEWTVFEQEVPALWDVLHSLHGKVDYMNTTCQSLLKTLAHKHTVGMKEVEGEVEKKTRDAQERDVRLDLLLQQYKIRLDLGEMMALHYGELDRFRACFPSSMDAVELGWELQRIYFYNSLVTDAKLADGHTMTKLRYRAEDEVKLHPHEAEFHKSSTLQISWHRLGDPATVSRFRTQSAHWSRCWDTQEQQPSTEDARFHSIFFTHRYGNNAFKDTKMQPKSPFPGRLQSKKKKKNSGWNEEPTLEELAILPALLPFVGTIPCTSFIRREVLLLEAKRPVVGQKPQSDLDFLKRISASTSSSPQVSKKRKHPLLSEEDEAAAEDMAFLESLGCGSTNKKKSITVLGVDMRQETEDVVISQRTDHTQLIRDLVTANHLWFQPAIQEEKAEVLPQAKGDRVVPLQSPYHLFLYQNLFQVSLMLIQLTKWYRHTAVTAPLALGLIHVNDLSAECRERYFSSYVRTRETVSNGELTRIEKARIWSAYRATHTVHSVRAPSIKNPGETLTFQKKWMNFYQDWAPPIVMDEYNPWCLRPTDAKLTPSVPAPEFPPEGKSTDHLTMEYFDSLAMETYMKADVHQLTALDTIYHSPITVVEGAAGSGKTTILQRLRGKSGVTMLVLVPTHQVRETITFKMREAMTTARFIQIARSDPLGWKQKFSFIQTVVMDEVGMLGESTAAELFPLLFSLPSLTRIVLLGDQQQLPPPSGGSVLRDIKSLPFVRVCSLQSNHRVVSNASDGLATLQAAYWAKDWEEVERMLLGKPKTSSSLSSESKKNMLSNELSQPFDSRTSSAELLALLKPHAPSVPGVPRVPDPSRVPGTDLIDGLRIHWFHAAREKEMYNYLYTCLQGRFGQSKVVTYLNARCDIVNRELLRCHLQTLPLGPSQKTIPIDEVGLVQGAPYRCIEEGDVLIFTNQGTKKYDANNPQCHWERLHKNTSLWVHEFCEISPTWMNRKNPTVYFNPHYIVMSSDQQHVMVTGEKSKVPYSQYLKKMQRQLCVRLSRDPPAEYAVRAQGWKRPSLGPESPRKKCPEVTNRSPLRRRGSDFQTMQANRLARFAAVQKGDKSASIVSSSAPLVPVPVSSSGDPGKWYVVTPDLLRILGGDYCGTVDGMQGSERKDIHFVCEESCSSARIKVAISRARQHCDVYMVPKLQTSFGSTTREEEEYYAAQLLVERLKKPAVERVTSMDIVSSFLFVVQEETV